MGESKSEIKNVGDPSEYKCPACGATPFFNCKDDGFAVNYHNERIRIAKEALAAVDAKKILRKIGVRAYGKGEVPISSGPIVWAPVVYHWESSAATEKIFDLPASRDRVFKTRDQALMAAFVFCHESGYMNVEMER